MSFIKQILREGSGNAGIPKRKKVTVHADLFLRDTTKQDEKGTGIWSTHLTSGFLFPATPGKPEPFTYTSGVGEVIKGWDDGVATMKKGEFSRMTIPWEFAYGKDGHPGFKIPPKSDLVFEIEVLEIN